MRIVAKFIKALRINLEKKKKKQKTNRKLCIPTLNFKYLQVACTIKTLITSKLFLDDNYFRETVICNLAPKS